VVERKSGGKGGAGGAYTCRKIYTLPVVQSRPATPFALRAEWNCQGLNRTTIINGDLPINMDFLHQRQIFVNYYGI
jgi:hypothetical protein